MSDQSTAALHDKLKKHSQRRAVGRRPNLDSGSFYDLIRRNDALGNLNNAGSAVETGSTAKVMAASIWPAAFWPIRCVWTILRSTAYPFD